MRTIPQRLLAGAMVGWELDIASDLVRLDPPNKEEITLLRLFDPRGYFIGS